MLPSVSPFHKEYVGIISSWLFVTSLFLAIPTTSQYMFNGGAVTTTLETLHTHACDGQTMEITCPPRAVISIQDAKYGRLVPSEQMCPPQPRRTSFKQLVLDNPFKVHFQTAEDTRCLAIRSVEVVSNLCEDRPSCSVLASPETFTQDPCMDTSKYLEVHYKCSPNEFEELTVCEDQEMDIACHQGNRIVIFGAMFGRKPDGTAQCEPHKQGHINCQATDTISEVRHQCHSRKRCSLLANASKFGDPCPTGVHKYLTVSYSCVPKKYLKQLTKKSGRKKKRKKKKRRKKKKKKKKRKGLDKLLPEVMMSTATTKTTTTTRMAGVGPESPFDRFYETFEKEDVTEPEPRMDISSEETSTADLVLINYNNNGVSSSKPLDDTSELSSSSQDHRHFSPPTATDASIPTTASTNQNPPHHQDTSEEPDFPPEETSPSSEISRYSGEVSVPESETQEVIPDHDQAAVTVNPKTPLGEEDDQDGYDVRRDKYDIASADGRAEVEITSQINLQPATEESTSVGIDAVKDNVKEDLSGDNLKSDDSGDNIPKPGSEHEISNSPENSERNDRDDNYSHVREDLSPERTSVASNPSIVDQHPKGRDKDGESVHKQGKAATGKKDRSNNNSSNYNNDSNNNNNNNNNNNKKHKPDMVSERNLTVAVLCPNNSKVPTDIRWKGRERPRDVRSIGFVEDWFSTWYFLKQHEEKAWLYFTLGACFGLIVLLVIILIKVCINFKRNIRARLDVSEPTHRSAHINNHSCLDAPMLEHSDSMDRIEFVQFHPRGTLRSMRSSNSHNRDIVNYYG